MQTIAIDDDTRVPHRRDERALPTPIAGRGGGIGTLGKVCFGFGKISLYCILFPLIGRDLFDTRKTMTAGLGPISTDLCKRVK